MRTSALVLNLGSAVLFSAAAYAQHGGPGGQPVVVAPIQERDLPASMRLVGTVLAERMSVVAAEIGGSVEEYPAVEGQFLRRGDVICRLDEVPMQLAVDRARGELGRLEAVLAELENGTRRETVDALRALMEEAQAMYDKWDFERKRVDDLFSRQQSSAKEKHDTDMELMAAQRRLTSAKAEYEQAVNGPRREEIDSARHQVASHSAVVRQAERDLANAEVRAPFDGFLVAKRTEIGEWIDVGGPVCEMVAIDVVKVRVDAPESAIPFATVGQPASVTIEALGQSRPASITRVIPRAAPSARTFPLEIELPNPDHVLLPGMFVWASVPAGPSGKRLVVSKDAIVMHGPAAQVFVIRPGAEGAQMAVPTPVSLGLESGNVVEVLGPGLAAGDLVVVRANERLYGPTPVMPMPAESQPAALPVAPGSQ